MTDEYRTVSIPTPDDGKGPRQIARKKLRWVCPKCGKPRGEIFLGHVYDGSLRFVVDCWKNECGHKDMYRHVINEEVS